MIGRYGSKEIGENNALDSIKFLLDTGVKRKLGESFLKIFPKLLT